MNSPGVSVIICCYNSEDRLPQTLAHLSRQKMPADRQWEVIVVDNASDDETGAIAKKIWTEFGNAAPLVVVEEPEPGLSRARSKGIAVANFEYILFCDDDNWLQEDYLALVFEILSGDTQIGIVGGCNKVVADGVVPEWFHKNEAFFAVGCQGERSGEVTNRNFLFGAGMAFRKSVFDAMCASGFKHLLNDRTGNSLSSGGDVELGYMHKILGYRLWFDQRLSLQHFMTPGRLTKSYLNKLQAMGLQTMEVLQVYDPYLKNAGEQPRAKPVQFLYFTLRYFVALIRPKKKAAYFLTYMEATNFLPVKFSRQSARIKEIIVTYHNRIKATAFPSK